MLGPEEFWGLEQFSGVNPQPDSTGHLFGAAYRYGLSGRRNQFGSVAAFDAHEQSPLGLPIPRTL